MKIQLLNSELPNMRLDSAVVLVAWDEQRQVCIRTSRGNILFLVLGIVRMYIGYRSAPLLCSNRKKRVSKCKEIKAHAHCFHTIIN